MQKICAHVRQQCPQTRRANAAWIYGSTLSLTQFLITEMDIIKEDLIQRVNNNRPDDPFPSRSLQNNNKNYEERDKADDIERNGHKPDKKADSREPEIEAKPV